MAPLPPHHHPLLLRDPAAPDNNRSQVSISPSLVVGICILAAIFFCILLASVTHLCSRTKGPEITENLFKPYEASQLERLQEVRRINNKYAWQRGHFARVELVKQGRRITAFGLGSEVVEDWNVDEDQDGYDLARSSAHPSPRLNPNQHPHHQDTHFSHRESYLLPDNPYAHPFRNSRMMRAKRTKHNADTASDDEEEMIDMDAVPYLQGLPGYIGRNQERFRHTPGSDQSKSSSDKSKGKKKAAHPRYQNQYGDSQTCLGPAIVKTSTGLDEQQARPSAYQQHLMSRDLTPEPSPTQTTRLMYDNTADLETINLNDHTASPQDPISPTESERSDTTIKALRPPASNRPISYQEDIAPSTIKTLENVVRTGLRGSADLDQIARQNDHERRLSDDRLQQVNDSPTRHGNGTPIIMINDDLSDQVARDVQQSVTGIRRVRSQNSNELPLLVNVGREAGAGDLNEIPCWEMGEERRVGGRYWNAGRSS